MIDTFNKQAVLDLVIRSPLATYNWRGRGRAPIGYLKGMGLVYARVFQHLLARDPIALEMAKPMGSQDRDAFAWYAISGTTERDRLRVLFTLLIGLGMRESSGNYGEGRDQSASNTTADTAEAGAFQMSWDITRIVPMIKELYKSYYNSQLTYGLKDDFHEGVWVSDKQLQNYGSGDGAAFQYMAKSRPAFAAEAAAVGLRNHRKHWGPINRKEAEVRPEADALLRLIEIVVRSAPTATVEPAPAKPVYTSIIMRLWDALLKLFGG